jgi:hypothetical protein
VQSQILVQSQVPVQSQSLVQKTGPAGLRYLAENCETAVLAKVTVKCDGLGNPKALHYGSSPAAATCVYLSVEMFEKSEWAVADKERSAASGSESAMLRVGVGVGVFNVASSPISSASSSLMSRRRSSRESVRAASMSSVTLSITSD